MNTAGKHRTTQAVIEEHIRNTEKRHTPVSRIKVAKDKKTGVVNIDVFTSRPEAVRMEARDIEASISEQSGGQDIKVTVVPEARAVAKFVRISPRKARFVLAAVKGKRVSEAIDILRFIPNHASEPILKVLKSAAANALDGWGAGVDELKVHNIIADGGPILKRIRARAQGRAYRILKRTSHLTVVLLETPKPALKRKPAARPHAKAVATPPVQSKAVTAPAAKPKAAKAKATAAKEPVVSGATVDTQEQTAIAETSTSEAGEAPVEQA
jgi:large subunit ribosomal protein L22